MMTEFFIEGIRIDISADISSLLTFAIDDVKDFSSRQTAFSKTIVIPGTALNNRTLGNIFDVGISNAYDPGLDNVGYNFNASKSARILIFQDYLQTFKGTARLLEVIKDKKGLEYELAFNGEITSLKVALSSGLLEHLDFSSYDHVFNTSNIISSWNNPGGTGYYYPLVDYGTYSVDKHSWDIGTFRPALYAKEYIDKMFSAAGFTYQCNLFNTSRFKSLIIPHNQKQLQALNSRLLSGERLTDKIILTSAGISTAKFDFESVTTSIFTNTTNSKFTYTGTPVGVTVTFTFYGSRRSLTTDYVLKFLLNGVEQTAQTLNIASNHGTFNVPFVWYRSFHLVLNTGDYIEFQADTTAGDLNYELKVLDMVLKIESDNSIYTPVFLGDTVQMNTAIPKNVRQLDFLLSIIKLFNIYVYESQFDERLIKMSPFVDYYTTNSTESRDWTYKLDRDQPIRIKPMSELNSKIYNFNYKDDTDYYNDLYKKRYNQGYGSYIFDSQFEFVSNENKLDLIFAATPLVGYGGEDKVYPTIFKRSGTVEESIDSVIRIMQSKKVTGVSSWNIKNGATVLTSTVDYGYAGHFDDPDNPDNDLNFGVLNELFFVLTTGDLTKTQFNVYWSSYMAEITDKDSKLLIAKFHLTPKDIFDLDFSKYIYLDGDLFRLNKIIDYDVSSPNVCVVELLKVINTTYTESIPNPGETYFWIDSDLSYILDSDGSKIKFF